MNIANYLAENDPVGGEYLVVEGWMGKDELDQALSFFENQQYKFMLVTGGPITSGFDEGHSTYADRASAYLLSTGFPVKKLKTIPEPPSAQDRTFLSAVFVREWFNRNNIPVFLLDVFSADVHARRSRDLFQLAFEGVAEIGVIASNSREYDLNKWWKSSAASVSVAKEVMGLIRVKCCFKVPEKGSHVEKWGVYE